MLSHRCFVFLFSHKVLYPLTNHRDRIWSGRDMVFLTERKPGAPPIYQSSFIVYIGVAREITHFKGFCTDLHLHQTPHEPPRFDGARHRSSPESTPYGGLDLDLSSISHLWVQSALDDTPNFVLLFD